MKIKFSINPNTVRPGYWAYPYKDHPTAFLVEWIKNGGVHFRCDGHVPAHTFPLEGCIYVLPNQKGVIYHQGDIDWLKEQEKYT